jgi:uncharacterized protein (DUF302 family)
MCGSRPQRDFTLTRTASAVAAGSQLPAHAAASAPLRGILISVLIGISLWGACAMAADGLITIPSSFDAEETADRLESEVTSRGMTVFARVDHAGGAVQAGMTLRPTLLLIFGNAKGGTPLMQADQAVGIDLPLKALVWEDADGKTWLSYNEPKWIVQRHGLGAASERVAENLGAALQGVTRAATERR